jgi:hypothetical protein
VHPVPAASPWTVLIVAIARHLARLRARWVEARRRAWQKVSWPPELADLDRRADVAMTMCTCGHIWHLHEHPHVRTGCDACSCQRFRPARRPDQGTSSPR